MPKVNIDVPSKYSAADTYSKIKKFFDESPELRKLDPGLKCTFNDAQMSGVAKGKVTAEVKVNGTGANSAVSIVVDLPLLMSPFKGVIKSNVEQKLNALLS